MRAGILSLARGQRFAGLALGLTLPQTYRYVLLPMAYRIILPPLTSEFLNVIKNSAVALTIGLLELTARARAMQEMSFQVFEAFTAATVIYIIINIAVTFGMRCGRAAIRRARSHRRRAGARHPLRRAMFADFDFDVIIRSLPYLFYDGMTFTIMLTALATTGGIIFGTAPCADAPVGHRPALGARGRLRQPDALGAAGADDLLVLFPGALYRPVGHRRVSVRFR